MHFSTLSIDMRPAFFLSLAVCVARVVLGAKDVWVIRHCDKPSDDSSDCCSSQGEARAQGWAAYFKSQGVSSSSSSLNVVTSNFELKSSSSLCIKGVSPANTDDSCQGSQRMYDTAFLLAQEMSYQGSLSSKYCSGNDDGPKVASYVKSQPQASQLVVWEHKQIVDIIRGFGINLSSWPSDLDDTYNIVFHVELSSPAVLSYSCYNYQNGSNKCDSGVTSWLRDYDQTK